VNEVAAYGPAHAVGVGFLAAIGDDWAKICGCAASREFGWMDEFASVGAGDFRASYSAVGEAADFVDVSLDVFGGFGSFDEVAVFEGFAGVGVDDGVDKVVAVWVGSAVENGMVASWLALGCVGLRCISLSSLLRVGGGRGAWGGSWLVGACVEAWLLA
jgi:hypothetical protein